MGASPENFSRWKFSGTERFTTKITFFANLRVPTVKNVAGLCALSLKRYIPKSFRAIPEVDLVSNVWRPGPSKVR